MQHEQATISPRTVPTGSNADLYNDSYDILQGPDVGVFKYTPKSFIGSKNKFFDMVGIFIIAINKIDDEYDYSQIISYTNDARFNLCMEKLNNVYKYSINIQ